MVRDSSLRETQANARGACRSWPRPRSFQQLEQSSHCAVGMCYWGLIVTIADIFSLLMLRTTLKVGVISPSQVWGQAPADSRQWQGRALHPGLLDPRPCAFPVTLLCEGPTVFLPPRQLASSFSPSVPIQLSTPYKPVSWCCASLS